MSTQLPTEAVTAAAEAMNEELGYEYPPGDRRLEELIETALEAAAPFIRADERARIDAERLTSVNREKLEARLHAMGLPADQVFMVLVLADEYGAYLIEKHARPPMRQRRREWGERERESAP